MGVPHARGRARHGIRTKGGGAGRHHHHGRMGRLGRHVIIGGDGAIADMVLDLVG